MEIISEGAEAQILKIDEKNLKKIRLEKPYRIKEIDLKLRKSRNKKEFKILKKLEKTKINSPIPFEIIDNYKNEISFTFEYIHGNILKEVIDKELLFKAFNQIILLHLEDIIHNDLTTLNMLEKNKEIYLIDFGLSEVSIRTENKAVDLNLFFNCIKNEHPDLFELKEELIQKYLNSKINKSKEIILKLKKVELRGRNK